MKSVIYHFQLSGSSGLGIHCLSSHSLFKSSINRFEKISTSHPKWQQQASGLLLPFGAQSTLLSPCTPRGQGEGSPYAASRLSPLSALRASERCTDRQERNVGRCQIFPIIFKSHHENLFDAKVAYSIPSFFYRSYHSNLKDPG